MTLLSPPAPKGGQPPEDLDWTLRALFRAQMPNPWPPAPATSSRRIAPPPPANPVWRPLLRSRMALAASVALLVTGLLFLAGAFQDRHVATNPAVPVHGTTADGGNDPMHHPAPPPITLPSESSGSPSNLKIDESLIQGPNGTMIRFDIVAPK